MSKVFFTSDTHFNHDRSFIWQPRGFTNVNEMNEEIVKRWNATVGKNDIVYHLGDVMLGGNDIGLNYLKRLNGRIFIALGNHDTETRASMYFDCDNIVDVQIGYRIKVGKRTAILSHYPTIVTNFKEEPLKVINLCGHCHTKDKFQDIENGCYHVELDAHNCYPVALDDILEDIKQKKVELAN